MAKDKEPVEILTASAEQTAEQITKQTQDYFGWLQKTTSVLPWATRILSIANGGCMRIFAFCFSSIVACTLTINIPQAWASSVYDEMIAAQAEANGVPVSLIHRVIMRESRYNPRAVSGGNYGLMQIRLGTARAMGYRGSAEGLLDPATNLTYAVRYLAGAYRAAHGNESRAALLYARGYYGEAKRRGFSPYGSSQ